MNPVSITTFYRFLALSEGQIDGVKSRLEALAIQENLRGLCLLGKEGVNATVSGPASAIQRLKVEIAAALNAEDVIFKDSIAEKHPFSVFKVKIKDEIVSLGKPDLAPESPINNHLSPSRWHEAVQDPDSIVLDTRNDYEVALGKFKSAVDFKLHEFNEFPEKLKAAGIAKEKRVLLYCTGGIRCEKAILEMQEQGYNNVFQLDGGILNYLKEYPDQEFAGECFVFDYRVAVDQALQPTRNYTLCPHCGQPANQPIQCVKCGRSETICQSCNASGNPTCSKNCAHHAAIGSGSRKSHLPELKKRNRI
jgi:UPF0176 protein